MKVTLLLLAFVFFAFVGAFAQTPRVTAEGKNISIAYGQPSKKGRVVLGKEGSAGLDKYDKVWRTGANASTEITFKKDGQFGGKAVKAGTYSLFSIPGETQWTVILNSVLKQNGAFEYEQNKSKDVLSVTVPAKKYAASAEKLTFKVSDKSVDLQWDKEGFSVPVKF
ncbi:DUF2911 domain-containing protein [Dyadobacter psychrotolerans]|uniref:DUF2911 domain-containing protein n=1 Tax=Dyadobacter psychrotolerans TaxID=2541721 RepID=A0A4R5DVL9_9BACT|nr:DUF2911 domain-containing protein [Dyadobacter psychrotolerans]TDE18499.1 DUF2911 domain-containing protein [Dyadobacter psychrotolerans]